MSTHRSLAPVFIFLVSLAFLGFSSCQPKQRVRSATEKHYDLKGKVIAVDKEKRELTIAHEDIKDYMSGMTMAFSVKDDWVYEIAAPGNQITATLIVDGTQSWLEDEVITEDSTPLSGAPPVEGAGPNAGDDVPDYGLVVGNPARRIGYVCPAGHREVQQDDEWVCRTCCWTMPANNVLEKIS